MTGNVKNLIITMPGNDSSFCYEYAFMRKEIFPPDFHRDMGCLETHHPCSGDGFADSACLRGIMGIRSLAMAAGVAAGLGPAADAATVDHVKMRLSAEYICEVYSCDKPAPPVSAFYGLPIDRLLTGWLSIGEEDNEGLRPISFKARGVVHDFGQFETWSGRYSNYDLVRNSIAFVIEWNGKTGSLWYRDDDAPWSLEVQGTISSVAPVPLPASAALLPLGIGALALMRRRRRSA